MSSGASAQRLTIEEFYDRLAGCAETVEATLDELEALILHLRRQRGIFLSEKLHGIPGTIWGVLGGARMSAVELRSVLRSCTRLAEGRPELLLERAASLHHELGQVRASGWGCCEFWDLGTSYLVWRRSDGDTDLLISPALVGGDGTLLPVLSCPFCGKDAPQQVQRARLGRSSIEEGYGSGERLGAMAVALFLTDRESDSSK